MLSLKCRGSRLRGAATEILLVMLLGGALRAEAQQGSFVPPPQTATYNQSGPVLEVPLKPSQSGYDSLSIPQLTPQPGQELELPSRALRSQPGYEQVTVTVTDQNGRYASGLHKGDFRLYIDDVQRSIEFLRQDFNTPVSVGIIVDSSGSMEPKIPQARTAIAQFIDDLNSRDDIFLYAFSTRSFLLQPFTQNHSLAVNRLALLHAYNDTALFDAIINRLIMITHGRYDKKALLVVTDGRDNASKSTLPQAVAEARRTGVLIYSIGIGDSSPGEIGFGIAPFILAGTRHVDERTLRRLSTESGARIYVLGEVGDGEMLRRDCAAISNELREQYTVGFLAPDPLRTDYRSLRVEVPGKPELTTRLRNGVTVRVRPETADAGSDAPTP
jgi:Ca-activated chloride channel homolog